MSLFEKPAGDAVGSLSGCSELSELSRLEAVSAEPVVEGFWELEEGV